MNGQAFLGAFSPSHVGGHVRPHRLFSDLFASPIMSPGETSRVGNEGPPMAPLRGRRLCFFEDEIGDGPQSDIKAEDLVEIRKKYSLPD